MVSTDSDRVILVDETDREIGTFDKLDAHRAGRLHRALSVIVARADGSLLLQKRAAAKYHSGGLWTNTCCSHPRPGEAVEFAAVRRLEEEMGITCPLTALFTVHYRAEVSNGLIENELVHVFGGRYEGEPHPNPGEVEDWRWLGPEEIREDIAAEPGRYSVWFRKYLGEFGREIGSIAAAEPR
ncbi:MAG: isopentenyl-diphosphate Delta-isomerase [Bauldia sp.]|uniref:isopentenyl-diphosphate Delta-isomerase n=1 Tax=Bauldia sp. TaxID=2575872 RepID=UPI001DE02E9B|nr:isopentenyl-diphosphate Delta-isomerase [Bauldia sp.]MCB1495971.1 isopentenyl-diphosphate Delta-isomerase [Bauldia sp.]